jgi:uracil-DNA glycosylase
MSAVLPGVFANTLGRRDAKILILGEYWTDDDAKVGLPFQGRAGQELRNQLGEAKISPSTYLQATALCVRPPDGDLTKLCVTKKELPADYELQPLINSPKKLYLAPQYLGLLDRLYRLVAELKPHVIVALGNVAAWATTGAAGITRSRGVITQCIFDPTIKVIPTYSPAYVLRQWSDRPIVLADLMKAAREAAYPEIRRPKRIALISPTLAEIQDWFYEPSEGQRRLRDFGHFGVDIETAQRQITMIGFADTPYSACVIPFVDPDHYSGSYWPNHEEELIAWTIVKDLLESPVTKVFQNGLYDLQYIYQMGIRPRNCTEDTMLMHHALYPEMKKGLEFLGSVYTNEASWKLMRKHTNQDQIKADA